MNVIERKVYDLIKKNQKLKDIIRDIYQSLMYLYPQKPFKSSFNTICRKGYFFGFHDKTPWSIDNQYILAHKYEKDLIYPQIGDKVDIGFFYGDNYDKFEKLGSTTTFNWQQGSMLQWIGNKNLIIFNDSTDRERNIAKIVDLSGNTQAVLPGSISHVSPDGCFALGYSFERLQKYAPGYGYPSGTDFQISDLIPDKHGIHLYNVTKGDQKLLFTVQDINKRFFEPKTQNSYQYFTHCLFSPSGKRFLFLHRSIYKMKYINTRLISSNLEGDDLFLFPTTNMVSHFAWKNDHQILAYCSTKEYKDAYILFTDKSNNYQVIGNQCLLSDGHPSFSPVDSNYFVTDTYPDRFRNCHLKLFDMSKDTCCEIGLFRQPLKYKDELRCDLHPRWDRKGQYICFDSAHSGQRSLCIIRLENYDI